MEALMATPTPQNRESDPKTRTTDAKGRVTLPKEFADCLVDIEQVDEFEVRIRKVVTIPEREAWLWKNSKALAAVMSGLAEAKRHEFVEGPDIAADAAEFGVEG
jgi:bifunctional DNA-binding transcriptional regulator/antitoxin component of YhaV-PrlF toxin-antitoxin module